MDLPRLVMRRTALVAAATLAAALVLGLVRADDDVDRELRAAMSLAAALARLADVATLDDTALVEALRAQKRDVPLRHLSLTLHDGQGRLVLAPAGPAAGTAGWLDDVARWQPPWRPAEALAPVSWTVPRSGGAAWTLTLSASPESERREALGDLAELLAALALGAAGMLAVMAWNVRKALQPLQTLSGAIGRIRAGDTAAARALPQMPVHELQTVTDALRALGAALDDAERERRVLARKVESLQEDERTRLARELHDELGQQLTALRLDATLLERQLRDQPAPLVTVQRLSAQCAAVQHDVRQLLARLAPRDGGEGGVRRLEEMLQALVDGWRRDDPQALRVRLDAELGTADEGDEPGAGLVLAVYRMSQEALTNVARHAGAHEATLRVRREGRAIVWSVSDDGIGIDDPAAAVQRGSGLAGLRERAWAYGADLEIGPAHDAPPGRSAGRSPGTTPGLRLRARLHDLPPETLA